MTRFGIEVDTSDVAETLEDTRDKWETNREYVVGTNVEYAVYLEFGRGPVEPTGDTEALRFEDEEGNIIYRARAEGHPPYPFFRPAIMEFEADPEAFIIKNTDFTAFREIPNADTLVKAIAEGLVTQMESNAKADNPLVDRSPGTHPDHPVRQSGTLIASIQAVRVS